MNVLAIPLLSSPIDQKFPQLISISVFSDTVRDFYNKNAVNCLKYNMKILLVHDNLDESETGMLETVQSEFENYVHFVEISGKQITSLAANHLTIDGKIIAIVNPANHRLSDRGGLVNQAIHSAVGSELMEKSLLQMPQGNSEGHGYKAPCVFTVVLSENNTFRKQEGVVAIIQAVSPNLNHNRPHCEESLESARVVLTETYYQIFMEFLRLLIAQQSVVGNVGKVSGSGEELHTNESDTTIVGNKRKIEGESIDTSATVNTHSGSNNSGSNQKQDQNNSFSGFNKNILYEYLKPNLTGPLTNSIYLKNDCCTVIYDSYPKAKTHLLVLPDPNYLNITEVRHLTPQHLEKIAVLHVIARDVARDFVITNSNISHNNNSNSSKHSSCTAGSTSITDGHRSSSGDSSNCNEADIATYASKFQIGYHAIPSLHPLHIHVISRDLNSPCLKHKKHWNSFSTDYFVPIDRVEKWLQSGQTVDSQLQSESGLLELLNTPLKCNQCSVEFKTMPALKQHISSHL